MAGREGKIVCSPYLPREFHMFVIMRHGLESKKLGDNPDLSLL